MRWIVSVCALFTVVVGCGKPLRTNSFIRLAPARVHMTADPMSMEPQILRDRSPLAAMPVQSGYGSRIALIDVDGLLINDNNSGLGSMGENPIDLFREKLDQVQREGNICAVILRINSYGGGVTASDIMRKELDAFRNRTGIPVVAVLMDVAAGGAYYLASAADQIVAHPTTLVGGLGVILNLYNLTDTMAQQNVSSDTVRSGELVDMGTPERMLEGEELELLEEIAKTFAERFKTKILASRGRADAEASCFDGRIFTGLDALEYGLVDQVGYVDDAIQIARGYAGNSQAGVIMLHRGQDKARTPYAQTPNKPYEAIALPHLPGLSRSRMPTYLYIWQPDPSLVK